MGLRNPIWPPWFTLLPCESDGFEGLQGWWIWRIKESWGFLRISPHLFEENWCVFFWRNWEGYGRLVKCQWVSPFHRFERSSMLRPVSHSKTRSIPHSNQNKGHQQKVTKIVPKRYVEYMSKSYVMLISYSTIIMCLLICLMRYNVLLMIYTELARAVCSVRLANHLPVLFIGFPGSMFPLVAIINVAGATQPPKNPAEGWLKKPIPGCEPDRPRKRLKNGTVISVRAWWNIRRCCQFITVGWALMLWLPIRNILFSAVRIEGQMESKRTHESSKMMVWIRMDNGVVPHHIDMLFGESSFLVHMRHFEGSF